MREQGSGSIFERLRLAQKELVGLFAIAILLALGVNIVSGVILRQVSESSVLLIGFGLILGCFVYLLVTRTVIPESSLYVDGFLPFDKKTNKLLAVTEYELASDLSRYLRSAFSENKAMFKQWSDEPLPKIHDNERSWEKRAELSSVKIIHEILEYFLLDEFSLHLSSYFHSYEEKGEEHYTTYLRADIPEILLRNRFLELFSRPMSEREAFIEKPWLTIARIGGTEQEVVTATGKGGALYDKFELALPNGSRVSRGDEAELIIETPILTLRMGATFDGFNENIPPGFVEHYMGIDDHHGFGEFFKICFEVSVRWKRRAFFSNKAWEYHGWAESFMQRIEDKVSKEAFFTRIQWPTILALLETQKSRGARNKREKQLPPGPVKQSN